MPSAGLVIGAYQAGITEPSPKTVEIDFSHGGSLVRIKRPSFPGCRRVGGRRGVCQGFSRASRSRMIELLASVNGLNVKGVFFVTLTGSPLKLNWQNIGAKRCAWNRRFKRRWGKCGLYSIIWRIEPQKSGVPHLHMLVLFYGEVPNLLEFRAWNDQAWAELVDDPMTAKVGCKVELIRTWRGCQFYLSKYCAKMPEVEGGTGRCWGVEGRSNLQVDMRSVEVRREVSVLAERVMVRLQRRKRRRVEYQCPSSGVWFSESRILRALNKGLKGPASRAGDAGLMNEVRAKWRCRVVRPKVNRTWFDEGWVWDPEARENVRVPELDQWVTRAPGRHFLDEATLLRLVEWAKAEYLRRLVEVDEAAGLPF